MRLAMALLCVPNLARTRARAGLWAAGGEC